MPFLKGKQAVLLLKSLQKDRKKILKNSKRSYKKEESSLVKACMSYLNYTGYLALRNNSGLIIINSNGKHRAIKMGTVGSPDIIACSPKGQFVAIECKSNKGKITPSQKQFLDNVRKRGGLALVVKNIDDLIKGLKGDSYELQTFNSR